MGGQSGMTPAQRAFLDAQVALSAWRAAKDVEAQVGEATATTDGAEATSEAVCEAIHLVSPT